MNRSKILFVSKTVTLLSVIPALIYAFSGGPPPGRTGAPGESTCWAGGCHLSASGAQIPNSSAINVDFGGSTTYSPGGAAQRWTVNVNDPQGAVFGFQLSTRIESTNGQAGNLSPVSGDSSIAVIQGGGGVQYIEHTFPRGSGSFSFDWTPPAADVGNVKVYLAVNAANGNFSPSGDRIHTRSFTLTAAATGPRPTISEGGVVNAWSFKPTIADGAWIAIFGENLAPTTRTWRADEIIGGNLPKELDEVKVRIDGEDAYVFFISPGQVNVQVPNDSSTGLVPVEVTTANGTSDPLMVNKQHIAPGIFTWAGVVPEGERFVGALFPNSDFSGNPWVGRPGLLQPLNIPTRPAKPDEFVLLFATGCGDTSPPFPAGQLVVPPVPRLTNPVTVRIGGTPAEVAENTGFLIFAGECQFNVKIPSTAPDGDLPVEVEIGGVRTEQDVRITVQR